MKQTIKDVLPKAMLFLFIFIILCGVIYTFFITGIAQVFFPEKANGSIIEVDGKKYGSSLLGQQYTDDSHMWGRIMSLDTGTYTDENGKTVMYAAPSNLSPASKEYEQLVKERVEKIKESHQSMGNAPVPVDLVTSSGSGLDPHISVLAAEYQVDRISEHTGKPKEEIQALIEKYTDGRFLGIFGEPVVNVLKVNLALDGILQ